MIFQMLLLHVFSILLVLSFFLCIIKIAIPVGVKIQQYAALFEYPLPFAVGFLRLLQIPGQIS